MIDPTYWLDDCDHILTLKVHKDNTEFSPDCADKPAGKTRKEQHATALKRVETKRAEEREEREQAIETRVAIRMAAAETNRELTNESILSSRQKRVNASGKNLERKIKMLERKIKMMDRHQKIFEKKHRAVWYEQKLSELLEALLACNVEQDVVETITPRKDDEDDGENNSGSSVPLPALPPLSVAAI
jgi:signal recognition particle GTPase